MKTDIPACENAVGELMKAIKENACIRQTHQIVLSHGFAQRLSICTEADWEKFFRAGIPGHFKGLVEALRADWRAVEGWSMFAGDTRMRTFCLSEDDNVPDIAFLGESYDSLDVLFGVASLH